MECTRHRCGIIELKLQDTAGCNLRHGALAAKFNRSDETVGWTNSVICMLGHTCRMSGECYKVLVRHEDKVVTGFLDKYDSYLNIAAVNVMDMPDLHTVPSSQHVKFLPHSAVVAVGCDIDGNLVSTGGMLTDDNSCGSWLLLSTCKISEVCEGGPLFDFDGNFVGINLCLGTEATLFLPRIIVLPWCMCCGPLENIKFPAPSNSSKAAVRDGLDKNQFGDLESLGYPKPLNDGMILVNTFEEPFGDECGEEGKRIFACTGLFIEWKGFTAILTSASLLREPGCEDQKIVKNLRIEVLLPNKGRAEGKLQHVSLHYNVALVSVKDFCASQPAVKVEHRWPDSGKVLAVGCCFSSGRLMAARGQKYGRPNVQFDCKYLGYSTCKITKAGIGGPLADLDGKFVGMNFYDKYVGHTPYLSWREIVPLLEYFETKGPVAEGGDYGNPSDKPDWTKEGDNSVSCNSATWAVRCAVIAHGFCHLFASATLFDGCNAPMMILMLCGYARHNVEYDTLALIA
uniref:Uncharacterized protein n=1 Tax=Aegilops tauschii TaxID=37682 RepID=M8BS56_AEGTA